MFRFTLNYSIALLEILSQHLFSNLYNENEYKCNRMNRNVLLFSFCLFLLDMVNGNIHLFFK